MSASHPKSEARFFVILTIVFASTIFAGFFPTYWQPVSQGTFGGRPIQHIHGALFFTWTVLLVIQASLIANGARNWHRQLGMTGVALAALMSASVVLSVVNSISAAELAGQGQAARTFSVVAITALVVFVVLVTAAIANVRRPDIHKRLMICTMPAMADAALGRLYGIYLAPPGPPGPPMVELNTEFPAMGFILAGMIFDLRVRGAIHPAYWFGMAVNGLLFIRVPLGATQTWQDFATWLAGLA